MNKKIPRAVLFGCLAAAGAAGTASATTVDLTTTTSGTINGGLFQQWGVQTSGTGAINSFLRMQNSPTEQGYNTSGRPVAFDEKTDPNFTHDLRLSDLVTRSVNGTNYYEFLLDTNEPNGGAANLVSLDQLKLFTSPTGSQTTANVSSLGTLRYDMDAGADSWVILNDTLSSGSGQADARILIPTSDFAGAAPGDFVYLYAAFGDHNASDGGFEEFATQSLTAIPLPSAGALGFVGVLGLVSRRRRA